MRQRLNELLRPLWAKHVSQVLSAYGHEELKADHSMAIKEIETLRSEISELKEQLESCKQKPLRQFIQMTCSVNGCDATRFRSGLCHEHYISLRLTKPI